MCVCICMHLYGQYIQWKAYTIICTSDTNHKTRLKNIRDVEIPEKQKARKQGRDDSIKAVQYIQPHPIYLSH